MAWEAAFEAAYEASVSLVSRVKGSQQEQSEVQRVQDTQWEEAHLELLEVGTSAAMAALFTVTMASLASGPLAAWEEAVTEYGAVDTEHGATVTAKHHTE